MVQRIDRRLSAILAIIAVAPFLPAAWEFMQHGVPDVLFTGDGAALELRVLRAARGVQFLGPYSLFGWSHPGPRISISRCRSTSYLVNAAPPSTCLP